MKKLIVTLCSLALSFAGTFGVNQISSNDENKLNTNIDNKEVVQYAEEAETQENLATDNETTVVNEATKETATEVNEAAPTTKEAEVKETNDDVNQEVVKKSSVKKDTVKKETVKKEATVANKAETKKAEVKNANVTNAPTKVAEKTNAPQTVAASNKNYNQAVPVANGLKNNNGQVFVYKNVDLSECDTTQEVINELQKNGINNINLNNIQNINGLEDILAQIQKDGAFNTAKPAPTTKPAAPAPTTKPAAPAPTTKPAAPATNTNNSSYADQVLQLVNQERAKAGLSAFTTNSTLIAAANKRAQETVQSFSHTRPNGSSFSTALKEYGVPFRTAGENIAYGQRSPQEVVTGWMNSPGHRANILNANFNKIGIGVHQQNGVIYWSQLFTN